MNLSTSAELPIAVDVMGGDQGPEIIVEGAATASQKFNLPIILVGDSAKIDAKLRAMGLADNSKIIVQHASQVIDMDDSPSAAIRGKADSSIRVAFELVSNQKASGVVSPGNTGAVMAAGLFVSGALPGIARPAIATLIPRIGKLPPTVLLDSGANVDCRAHQLVQFALMGKYYAQSALSLENPRIALLSNGSETGKGTDIIRSAAAQLKELGGLNFVGFAEGRDICRDLADVVVCDGFVGNVVLKAMEGSVDLVFDSMKQASQGNVRGKFGLWLLRPVLRRLFLEKLDPSAYGGAPLLGLNDIAIICHGSSNARAIMNAVRIAHKFVAEKLVDRLSEALSGLDQVEPRGAEDGLWNQMGQKLERKKKKETTTDSM